MIRSAAFLAVLLAVFAAEAKIDLLCVYYPHWHSYPKGDEWFHPGWTEWEYVRDAVPRFPGHRQPMRPVPGYLDGASPADVSKEIDLAADAGIDAFIYDYYYYNGEVTQEEAIEKGFLRAPNRSRMKFALMWCYHERSFAWRPEPGKPRRTLAKLAHTKEELLGLIRLSIERYFRRSEYYRLDGRLFFSIYDAKYFLDNRGGDPVRAKAELEEARALVRAAGLGELHINGQNPWNVETAALLGRCGFDSLTHYNPDRGEIGRLNAEKGLSPWLVDQAEVMKAMIPKWKAYADAAGIPFIPNVSVGWDSSPRCRKDVPFPWPKREYPYDVIATNDTPRVLRLALGAARRFAERDPRKPGAVYLNGWNEYTEGTYLLPDDFYGDGRLRAVESVFGKPRERNGRVVH